MENLFIETWDLRGWMGNEEPTPNSQRDWNKTLIKSIMSISNKIHQVSRRGGGDTIILHPDLELLLHPDYYDDFNRKFLMFDVVFDPAMEKDRIEVNCQKVLNNLLGILVSTEGINDEMSMIEFKALSECSEEEIKTYMKGLVGFVIIENI